MSKTIVSFFKTKLGIALSIVVVLAIIATSCFAYYNSKLDAVSSSSDEVYFQVVEGDTTSSIIDRLEDQGIVKDASMLSLYAKMKGVSYFEIGTYKVNKKWSARTIIHHLSDKDNLIQDQVLLTFREGIWAKDIAEIIGEATNVPKEELLTLWNDETFLRELIDRYEFLDESILNSVYPVKLEGYLFPESYFFKLQTTPEEITYTFLNQFESEYNKIKDDIANSGYTVHEIVTLASVVQFESKSKEDMEMIAGVFYNRLAVNQRLESSVTVCYSLYEDFETWEDCEINADVDSPYNTYQNEGLPIGPILNPGKDALEATLNPKEHDYYYFVADVNGDGTVYYSKTYEEHQEKVKKYLGY